MSNMEQGLATTEAAEEADVPGILQARRGARAYANDVVLTRLIDAVVEFHPHAPVRMHLDHGNTIAICVTAIQDGFTSVMIDGSLEDGTTPADFAYNVDITRRVVEMAHAARASIEGVLGLPETGQGDQEDGRGATSTLSEDRLLTDPEEALRFVAETGVDALAAARGTSHGAYSFTREPTGEALAMHVIKAIHARLPNTHLVMHGSSSVPQELCEIINAHGGEIRSTWGTPMEELRRGIRHGVRKVNIDTDIAWRSPALCAAPSGPTLPSPTRAGT